MAEIELLYKLFLMGFSVDNVISYYQPLSGLVVGWRVN